MAKLTTGLLIGVGAALALSACAQAPPPPAPAAPPVDQAAEAAKAQMMQVDQNKMIAQQLFSVSMAQRAGVLAKLESPDYVDHNPMFALFDKLNNVSGSAGMQLFFTTLQKLNPNGMPRQGAAARGPKPPDGNPLFQVVAGPDSFTVVHEQFRPDPSAHGSFYPVFTFDAFKVANGMLTEHWDGATLPTPLPVFLRVPADKLHYPKPSKASAHHRAD